VLVLYIKIEQTTK